MLLTLPLLASQQPLTADLTKDAAQATALSAGVLGALGVAAPQAAPSASNASVSKDDSRAAQENAAELGVSAVGKHKNGPSARVGYLELQGELADPLAVWRALSSLSRGEPSLTLAVLATTAAQPRTTSEKAQTQASGSCTSRCGLAKAWQNEWRAPISSPSVLT